jgi:hypothetical protein
MWVQVAALALPTAKAPCLLCPCKLPIWREGIKPNPTYALLALWKLSPSADPKSASIRSSKVVSRVRTLVQPLIASVYFFKIISWPSTFDEAPCLS